MLVENKVFGSKVNVQVKEEKIFNTPAALDFSWRPFNDHGAAKDLVINRCAIFGQGYGEGLKLSFPNNVYVCNTTIYGGYEDVVDIVRGYNVHFKNCTFFANKNTKNFFTIKGGVKKVKIEDCTFSGNIRDLFLFKFGDWTDYDIVDRPEVRNIIIKNNSFDLVTKKKFLYLAIHSEIPTLSNNKGTYFKGIKLPKLLKNIFWMYKKNQAIKPGDERELIIYPIER
jgi:hypothetical protein